MGVFDAVPEVGQGTWAIEDERKDAIRALRRGIELGLTHIDTAEMYGGGEAEKIVGEAIEGSRDKVFIVSKVLPQNASYQRAIRACEGSLKRLRVERIDVYLLHWREETPLEETFRAFDELVAEGKIGAWGVSNFDVSDMEEAERIAGPGKIACNQVLYNPWTRTIERRLLPWCSEHGVPVVAYSPFGQRNQMERSTEEQLAALAQIAEAHGAGKAAVALRFLIEKGTWTIPKASQIQHVEENAMALKLSLTPAEMKLLESVFPEGRPGPLPIL